MWDVHAGSIGQLAHRIHKAQPFFFPQKRNGVTANTATKTMVIAIAITDVEGWGFFTMKRAKPGMPIAFFRQFYMAADHLRKASATAQFIHEM